MRGSRMSYVTHTYCVTCQKYFDKIKYPEIIWCPEGCGKRVRQKPKNTINRRKNYDAYEVARY